MNKLFRCLIIVTCILFILLAVIKFLTHSFALGKFLTVVAFFTICLISSVSRLGNKTTSIDTAKIDTSKAGISRVALSVFAVGIVGICVGIFIDKGGAERTISFIAGTFFILLGAICLVGDYLEAKKK